MGCSLESDAGFSAALRLVFCHLFTFLVTCSSGVIGEVKEF